MAGSFDSENSSQSQETNGAEVSSDIESSPIKPAGGKRILDDSSSPQNGTSYQNGSSESELKPAHKRIRILSDSESDCSPVKVRSVPLAEEVEKKVSPVSKKVLSPPAPKSEKTYINNKY